MKTKKKVGVVLGTGGSRGLVHIGVLKVLEKNKIPIHRINGCSIGAVIAAAYASGMSAKEMENRALIINWEKFCHKGALIPFLGSVNITKIKQFLYDVFGDKKFSELKIPLEVVTTELMPNLEFKTRAINSGKLVPAIMASISVPFFFKIVKFQSSAVFDGGVFDPLPVDMMEQEVDVIITSTVHARHIINKKNRIISIYTDTGKLSWLDYSKVRECIKLGELAARERIGSIKRVVGG